MKKIITILLFVLILTGCSTQPPFGGKIIPDNLKLKTTGDKILDVKEVDDIQCLTPNNCINKGKIIKYDYVSDVEVATNTIKYKGEYIEEDLSKRTEISRNFRINNNSDIFIISSGKDYKKVGEKWFKVESGATTTVDSYKKQTENIVSKIKTLFIGEALALYYPSMDGCIANVGNPYSTIHDASTGSSIDPVVNEIMISNYYVSGNYYLYRSAINFNTSSIGSGKTVTAATLSLHSHFEGQSNVDSDSLSLVSNTITSDTVYATTDFGSFGTTKFSTDITFASMTADTWSTSTLNSIGLSAIVMTGITKFGLRTAKDIANTQPSGATIRRFDSSETSYKPYLVVATENSSGETTPNNNDIIIFE